MPTAFPILVSTGLPFAAFGSNVDPVQRSLLTLVAAALVLYAGVRLLWAAVPTAGMWRGAAVAVPIVALALQQTTVAPGAGVALLVGAGVLALTLGLGVSTLDLPDNVGGPEHAGSPLLRSLLPMTATVCLAGFHGELSLRIAGGLLVVGVLSLWTADGERQRQRTAARPVAAGVPAAALLVGGVVLLALATTRFRHAAGNAALTPVVVLLTVPAALLAMVGLLAAEGRRHDPRTPQETVTGFTLACLGVGLPLTIVFGRAWPKAVALADRFAGVPATTRPASAPASAVLMPLATWRIDSVLLLVVAALLVPVGAGRLRLGRLEGMALVLLYLAYAAVATRVGGSAG